MNPCSIGHTHNNFSTPCQGSLVSSDSASSSASQPREQPVLPSTYSPCHPNIARGPCTTEAQLRDAYSLSATTEPSTGLPWNPTESQCSHCRDQPLSLSKTMAAKELCTSKYRACDQGKSRLEGSATDGLSNPVPTSHPTHQHHHTPIQNATVIAETTVRAEQRILETMTPGRKEIGPCPMSK